MKIPMFHVDAFTERVFCGNPAAVCVLEEWPDDVLLQSIAAENNLSETAFLVKKNGSYDLRWFTPEVEVDLCGHATLASAFVVSTFLEPGVDSIDFNTASGVLNVENTENLFSMDFPSRKPVKTDCSDLLLKGLSVKPVGVYQSRDLLVILQNETQVRELNPDFIYLQQIKDSFAVIVSAKGDSVDFVSRFFAPNAGILEDPVTGSAHCTLIPFWAKLLGKQKMHALQLSKRGGELFCEDKGNRVKISGKAVLFSKADIFL